MLGPKLLLALCFGRHQPPTSSAEASKLGAKCVATSTEAAKGDQKSTNPTDSSEPSQRASFFCVARIFFLAPQLSDMKIFIPFFYLCFSPRAKLSSPSSLLLLALALAFV